MLDGEQFVRWCQQLGLAEPTRKYIELLRSSPPARVVRSRAGNVSGRYRFFATPLPSEKNVRSRAGNVSGRYLPVVAPMPVVAPVTQ